MADSKLNDIIRTSLEEIKSLVDVNTVVGEPITTTYGTIIIPVSKVSMGFASGGVDYFGKNNTPENKAQSFGGGGGTGVSVQPLGFLVVHQDGSVDMLNVAYPTGPASAPDLIETISALIEKSPEIVKQFKAVFAKNSKTPEEEMIDSDDDAEKAEPTIE